MSNLYQLGWFSTGRDRAARDLLEAVWKSIKSGDMPAGIAFVFCSREGGESPESDLFMEQVRGYGIPLVSFSYEKYRAAQGMPNPPTNRPLPPWRLGYDREVMKRLEDYRPGLCVLAGYMLIAGRDMCQRYDIINLHPAAPGGPTGTWQEVIWQLIESNADAGGVMMHLVTPELDRGPVVSYVTYPLRGRAFDRLWAEIKGKPIAEIKRGGEDNRLFKLVREHGLAREFPLIIATLKAFSQGKIMIGPQKTVVDAAGGLIMGYNMTEEINKLLRR